MSRSSNLPPRLAKALERPSTSREPWTAQLLAVLVATFLWAAYCDSLATLPLSVGGGGAAILGAMAGGLVGAVVLYAPAALLGLHTRQPLIVVASSTFGATGVTLVPGLLLGVVQIIWFAVAVHYAVEWNLRGLVSLGFLAESSIRAPGWGWAIPRSPVYGVTAALWGIAAALVSTRFIRWIAALMFVFPIFSVMALGGAVVSGMTGPTPGIDPTPPSDPSIPGMVAAGQWIAASLSFQFVFGFIAILAIQAVNWGATLRSRRDVTFSGLVGIGLLSTIVAGMAIVTVTVTVANADPSFPRDRVAAAGKTAFDGSDPSPIPATPARFSERSHLSLGAVFEDSIGGTLGGLSLIAFGLASMAFAVYAAYSFSNRLEAVRRRPRRWAWGVIGAVAALPIMVTGLAANVPLIIDMTAAVVAPILGAITADLARLRGRWAGPAPEIRYAGYLAWSVGTVAGSLPVIGRLIPVFGPCRWWPASLLAFGFAFVAEYALSIWLDRKRPAHGKFQHEPAR